MRSDTITKLLPALIAARGEFTAVRKDATNPHFNSRYADMPSVLDACEPWLGKHGLAVLQTPQWAEGMLTLVTTLAHTSGEWVSSEYPMAADYSRPQVVGAALTYARRYAYLCIVGVAPEDDDGETASGRGQGQGQRRDQPQRQTPRQQAAPPAAPAAAPPAPATNPRARNGKWGNGTPVGATATRTATIAAKPATDKQLVAIRNMVALKGIDLEAILNELDVVMLEQLSDRQAADVISGINGTDGSAVFGRDE